MTAPASDGASVRIPPPLVFLSGLVLGTLLHLLLWPLPIPLAIGPRALLAAAFAAPAIAFVGAAFRLFKSTGQDPAPWKATPEIISTGIYRYTRNPMYVGLTLLQTAIGIGFGNAWIVALAPVALSIVYFTAVRFEEAYLEQKFGDSYRAYKASVRRWL